MSVAKMPERIEALFGLEPFGGAINIVLDGGRNKDE